MSTSFSTVFTGKEVCREDTGRYRFERPSGYTFLPGQWFRLTLSTVEGEQTRTFSHASAPGDPWIELATRLSGSPFKHALQALQPGETVRMLGPGGRLTLPEKATAPVFLIGGVGITPVLSILRDAVQRGRRFEDALLVYGNRDPACVLYRDELLGMSEAGVRVVEVYQNPPEDWPGERGLVSAQLVLRHLDFPVEREFVVAGPPAMVTAMQSVLDELGVADDKRRIESFGSSP